MAESWRRRMMSENGAMRRRETSEMTAAVFIALERGEARKAKRGSMGSREREARRDCMGGMRRYRQRW